MSSRPQSDPLTSDLGVCMHEHKTPKRYLSQFETETFDSLLYDSTTCASRYKLTTFATMATYWVPDLPNIDGFSGHL